MENLYLIDSHCHLWHPEYHFDLKRVLRAAINEGIKYFVNVGVDVKTSLEAIKIARKYSPVYASVGFHPHYAKDFTEEDKLNIKKLLGKKKVVALGEIGLDFYRKLSNSKTQLMLMDEMLELWQEVKYLPLIIHNRKAHKEILSLLDNIQILKPRVIMHCFSGDRDFLEQCLKRGYFISYATNLTYNSDLQELVKYTPLEKLLLETDSPYLPPAGRRNERNQPLYIKNSLSVVAKQKNISEEDVMRALELNVKVLFGINSVKNISRVVYVYNGKLYLNITNDCSNHCYFCFLYNQDYFAGYNLRLRREPRVKDILRELKHYKEYREVTFCGLGEPFTRLEKLKDIARALKNKGCIIRIVTNGQGNLIGRRNVLPELKGIVDKISVSLNVDNENEYNRICKPRFGKQTFNKIIEFIQEAKKYLPEVEITFLNLPGVDIDKCRQIASNLGVNYRIRNYNIVV